MTIFILEADLATQFQEEDSKLLFRDLCKPAIHIRRDPLKMFGFSDCARVLSDDFIYTGDTEGRQRYH